MDSQNALGQALNIEVVPNGIFIDEIGNITKITAGGFEVRSPKTIQAVEEFLAQPKPSTTSTNLPVPTLADLRARLQKEPDNGELHLKIGQKQIAAGDLKAAEAALSEAIRLLPPSPVPLTAMASIRMVQKKKEEAINLLNAALKLDSKNYVIRKQRWLILYPDKFHPTIDWAWQRDQMKKELDSERDGLLHQTTPAQTANPPQLRQPNQ